MIRPHQRIPHSRPVHPAGAVMVRRADPDRVVEVTVVLKSPRWPLGHPNRTRADQYAGGWPGTRIPFSRREFEAYYRPANEVVRALLGVAKKEGITVVEVSAARHDIVLRAPIGVLERAYRVRQFEYQHERGRYLAHDGPLKLPGQLSSLVLGVLGMDDIRHGEVHLSPARGRRSLSLAAVARHYRFPDLPAGPAGRGRIAILEFGGGVHREDLEALRRTAPIRLQRIHDGAGHSPGNRPLERATLLAIMRRWKAGDSFQALAARFGATFTAFMETIEATMDAQIVSGLMPDTPIDLVFACPSADGWRRALYAQIGYPYPDSVTGPRYPSTDPARVVSVSWGMEESAWGRMKLKLLHGAIKAAGRLGTTVVCSTGDFGSRNSPTPTPKRSVNYPATSTWALACGGTSLRDDGAERREVAWLESYLGTTMAGGGGMSGHFGAPPYQRNITKPDPGNTWLAGKRRSFRGRWIPDVSAHAGFDPGIAITLLGRPFVGGGTSAAAPIWAALIGRLSDRLGRPLGWLHPVLYRLVDGGVFRDVREGHNDLAARPGRRLHFRATRGWDPCTGLGSPDGTALLAALEAGPGPAGAGRSATAPGAPRRSS